MLALQEMLSAVIHLLHPFRLKKGNPQRAQRTDI